MSDYLKKITAIKEAEQVEPRCWRCGAGTEPPPVDEQIEELARAHAMRGQLFTLSEAELANLRRLLQPGDVIAVCANVFRVLDPNYGSVTIIQGNNLIEIDRRELGS